MKLSHNSRLGSFPDDVDLITIAEMLSKVNLEQERSIKEIARLVCDTEPRITDVIKLLQFSTKTQQLIREFRLPFTHCRIIQHTVPSVAWDEVAVMACTPELLQISQLVKMISELYGP